MLEGTPTRIRKLEDGNGEKVWGARIVGNVDIGEGMDVKITSRKGKTWVSVVDEETWTDGYVHVCTLKRKEFSGQCVDCERPCKKIYERCWGCAQKAREAERGEQPPW